MSDQFKLKPYKEASMMRTSTSNAPFVVLTVAINCIIAIALCASSAQPSGTSQQQLIQTITRTSSIDTDGVEVTELAFRAPAKGVPEHVIDIFCANIKLKLYWGVYRETVKSKARTSQDVRRISRLARHYYPEIRSVDSPFNAPRLSKIDEYFGVKEKIDDLDKETMTMDSESDDSDKKGKSRIKQIKMKFKRKLTHKHDLDEEDEHDEEIKQKMSASLGDNSAPDGELTKAVEGTGKPKRAMLEKIRDYVKKYAPKVGMGIYTRWSTMWWLMMSCLYTKYYLWDPALDEFIKLKKTMIMYPDLLLVKLQDIDCLPTKFFQKIISACKILNPLLNYSFGQLSLDNMMRFKGQAS